MSAILIRSALEAALYAITPAIATVAENAPYTPTPLIPYQQINLLLAPPLDSEVGGLLHTEQGYMQVSLYYPLDAGPGTAAARAELIRSTFYRGRAFSAGGVTVTIERTPEISPARIEPDFYVVPVKIRFFSHILRS